MIDSAGHGIPRFFAIRARPIVSGHFVTRIFFGNFNFEYELAAFRHERERGASSGVVDANAAEWTRPATDLDRQLHAATASAWVAVAGAGDLVVTSDPVDAAAFSELASLGWPIPQFATPARETDRIDAAQFIPWGWATSVVGLATNRGWECKHPSLELVRQINSRRFRFELETALGVALRGSGVSESVEGLQKLVADAANAPLGWVLKANFGMAGRESVRGRGGELSEPLLNWARRRMAQTGCVVFEPIVAAVAEAGIQIEVPESGRPELIGVTPLLVDRAGTYRGSRFGNPDVDAAPWQVAVDFAVGVAERLQKLGYFGPLGIDAMQYRTAEGEIRLRPLQDLNARFTMGRLALGFEPLVSDGWCATWLQAPRRAAAFIPRLKAALQSSAAGRARLVTTSPDGNASHHSMLILAESTEARTRLETDYVRACAALARSDSTAP